MLKYDTYIAIFHEKWHHRVMFYPRILNLQSLIDKKSHFLLGPRSTGKSLWIKKSLAPKHYFNLLEQDLLRSFTTRPSELRERILADKVKEGELIVIDEIQKVPALLDEVHSLIESHKICFLLTGSSARKLKRGAANLLAGRAWMAHFFPLTWKEITDFDLLQYLSYGGLPQVYTSDFPMKEIKNYVNLYIKEEIQEEGLIRNLSQFLTFFESIGTMNGEELNYQGWSSDTGVPRKTLQSYVELLRDTLMAFELAAFTKTKKRKAVSRSKFYLFDVGVANHLAHRGEIKERGHDYGRAFEHFIIQECRALNSYLEKEWTLSYWRSHSQMEVDLCLGTDWALEIKAIDKVGPRHLKGLKALKEENIFKNYGVISLEKHKREVEGITIWPWQEFFKFLWSDKS